MLQSEPTPDSAASTSAPLPAGVVIGDRYRVERLLGMGAMGAVYLVEHVHMRKRFALKLILPEHGENEEMLARFEREAVAAANIDHPNVAAATDFGRTGDGAFFLVLEHVEGVVLGDEIARGPLAPGRAVAIAWQIARALAKAHGLGIVHRDLKPDNVMLVGTGAREVVKVLDFGVAKMAVAAPGASGGPGAALTRVGTIVGTPAYMAPEQALGQPVDGRADLYSLGIVLYHMVAGRLPFDAEDLVAMLAAHLTEVAPALRTRAPQGVAIPEALEAVVTRLLAKQPEARFPDAAATAAALENMDGLEGWLPSPTPPSSQHVVAPLAGSAPQQELTRSPTLLAPVSSAGRLPTVQLGERGSVGTAVTMPGNVAAISGRPAVPRWRAVVDDAVAQARPMAARALTAAREVYGRVREALPAGARPAAPFLLGAFALFAVVVPLIVLVLVFGRAKPTADRLAASSDGPRAVAPGLPEARIRDASKGGTAPLEALAREFPEDARVQRELVRVYLSEDRAPHAMRALGRLVTLDPAVAEDSEMREALRSGLDGAYEGSAAALRVAEGPFGTRGIDVIHECASQTGPSQERCAQSLAKPEVRAHATPALRALLDLQRATTCDAAREALPAVARDGDARAVPVLERLQKKSGCGRRGRYDCFPCLRQDTALEQARAAVEGRAAAGTR